MVGYCYFHGEGVNQDTEQSIEWFKKSLDQGNMNALAYLATAILYGNSTEIEKKQAINYLEMACEANIPDAFEQLSICYFNGVGVEKNYKKFLFLAKKAVDLGCTYVESLIGLYYLDIEENESESFKLFTEAAKNGSASAKYYLGKMYQDGLGVEKNEYTAFMLFKSNAEEGDFDSHFMLSVCYFKGIGTPVNIQKAYQHLEIAAKNGVSIAQIGLALHIKNVLPDVLSSLEAMAWLQKAVDQGDINAFKIMGDWYYEGYGVEKDAQKACEYYKIAADAGDDAAKEKLKNLFNI